MKINIFSTIYLDRYFYDDKLYSEELGGGGLNKSIILKKYGFDINLIANVGDDALGASLLDRISSYGISIDNISIVKNTPTGIFEANNDQMCKVIRGANDFDFDSDIIDNIPEDELIMLETGITKNSVKKILNKSNKIVLDIGPRVHILNEGDIDINKDNIVSIGNRRETKFVTPTIKKMSEKGVMWDDIIVKGNEMKYSYTICAGDFFEGILVANYIKTKDKRHSLRLAIDLSEKICNQPGGIESKIKFLNPEFII